MSLGLVHGQDASVFVLAALSALGLPHTGLVASDFGLKKVLLAINFVILGFEDGESVLFIVKHWRLALLSAARNHASAH